MGKIIIRVYGETEAQSFGSQAKPCSRQVPSPRNGFVLPLLASAEVHPSLFHPSSPGFGFWAALPRVPLPSLAVVLQSPCPRRRGAVLSLGCRNGLSIPEIQALLREPTVTQPPSRNPHYRLLAFFLILFFSPWFL